MPSLENKPFPTYEDYLKDLLGIYNDGELDRFLNLPYWEGRTMQVYVAPEDRYQEPSSSPEPSLYDYNPSPSEDSQ